MNSPAQRPTHSKTTMGLIAAAMSLAIGYIDYIKGCQISLFIFYAGPILFAVWFGDRDVGRLIATFCGVVWWWADWKSGHPYFYDWGQVWETIVRFSFFFFVSAGGAAMKIKQDAIAARLIAHVIPKVSTTSYNALSDVAPLEFWSPYK